MQITRTNEIELVALAIAIIAVILYIVVQSQSTNVPAATTSIPAATTTVPIAQRNLTGAVTVQIQATDSGFFPSVVNAAPGEKIALTLHNTGSKPHDLYIPFVGANTTVLAPGASNTIIFVTPPTEYNMTFYSTVNGDKAAGLTGYILVSR